MSLNLMGVSPNHSSTCSGDPLGRRLRVLVPQPPVYPETNRPCRPFYGRVSRMLVDLSSMSASFDFAVATATLFVA